MKFSINNFDYYKDAAVEIAEQDVSKKYCWNYFLQW